MLLTFSSPRLTSGFLLSSSRRFVLIFCVSRFLWIVRIFIFEKGRALWRNLFIQDHDRLFQNRQSNRIRKSLYHLFLFYHLQDMCKCSQKVLVMLKLYPGCQHDTHNLRNHELFVWSRLFGCFLLWSKYTWKKIEKKYYVGFIVGWGLKIVNGQDHSPAERNRAPLWQDYSKIQSMLSIGRKSESAFCLFTY